MEQQTTEQQFSIEQFKRMIKTLNRDDLESLALQTFETLIDNQNSFKRLIGEKWGILK